MRRAAIYLSWTRAERGEFWEAWRWLALARLSLAAAGVNRSLRWLVVPAMGNDPGLNVALRAAAWNKVAARYVPDGVRCLPASLALVAQLCRRGIACELRIGAQASAETLDAHAWVELDGRPINDTADVSARFPPFGAVPPTRAP